MIIAVDPGHGGRDPGAVGIIEEIEVTYPWARFFVAELIQAGVDARLTHEEPRPGKKVSINARWKAANSMEADLLVSVHANACDSHRGTGAEVLVRNRDSIADRVAARIVPGLVPEIGMHGKGIVYRTNLGVLNHSVMPAVLLEVGYVDNPQDASLLMQYTFLRRQAQRVAHIVVASLPALLAGASPAVVPPVNPWKAAGEVMRDAWQSIMGRGRA